MLILLSAEAFKFKSLLLSCLLGILDGRLMQDFTDISILGRGQNHSLLRLILFLSVFHEDLTPKELSQRLLVDPVWLRLKDLGYGSLSKHLMILFTFDILLIN